jgi:single stranded DNA-binding protein
LNNVNLIGRLTADPKLIESERSGRTICVMRIVAPNGRASPPTFVDVLTFDGQAYVCAEFLAKGNRVAVSGQLTYREWKDAEGKHHERLSVIGWVDFLERPPQPDAEPPYTPEQSREQLLAA